MRVKFTRKRLYINGIGAKVKGEGKKTPRLKCGCEGACRVARVWGSGEEWCILDEKEWTLVRKSCCFPRRDREGERGGRKEGQRPVGLSMGAPPPIDHGVGSATAHSGAK